MTRARWIGRAIIGAGLALGVGLSLIVEGGPRHLPWVAFFTIATVGVLWWNGRSGYRRLDAGDEVFIAAMIIFISMLVWARVAF